MKCINCGASLNPNIEKCEFCDTYWNFEKKSKSIFHFLKNMKFRKIAVYPIFITFGIVFSIIIYIFMFDNFSEIQLITLSPIWYFSIICGLYGYKAEDLIKLIVSKKAKTFSEAYKVWLQILDKQSIVLGIIARIFFFPFNYFKKINPLNTALVGAFFWGIIFGFFFQAVWPIL